MKQFMVEEVEYDFPNSHEKRIKPSLSKKEENLKLR